jgi:DNA polymerase-3 subunit epsilon
MNRGISTAPPQVLPNGFVVVDTETTGLHDPARVIEIALVFMSPLGKIENVWTSLVRGDGSAGGPRLERIHGIRDADLVSAPTFASLAPKILHSFGGRIVFAHNAAFDRSRLSYEFSLLRRRALPAFGCTMHLGNHLGHGILKLADAANRFGISHENAHAALPDAVAAAELLRHYMRSNRDGFRNYLAKKGFI